MISLHLPRNTQLLDASAFELTKRDAILINTSLGPTFDISAFCEWIEKGTNYAIFDDDGATPYQSILSRYPNVICSKDAAGWTEEAQNRG